MSKATTTDQLRLAANRAQGNAASVAQAAADAIEELDKVKADKAEIVEATLVTTGWATEEAQTDTEADGDEETEQGDSSFPYYYDIAVTDVTANDRADVNIVSGSIDAARACGFSAITKSSDGTVRVWAQLQPETDITVQCSIMKGATS